MALCPVDTLIDGTGLSYTDHLSAWAPDYDLEETMNTITREELVERLCGEKPVHLLMTLTRSSYERQHIPGTLHFEHMREAAERLPREEAVVVYDTNPACPASYRAYYQLRSLGFKQVYRFAGGLEEWSAAGYPLEGKGVTP